MVDLQGHRGARGLFPENTLEGIGAALALGITCVEIDVAVTRDGVAVVHHDPALNPDLTRDPHGEWLTARGPLLRELSWVELEGYDIGRLRPGSRTATLFPDQVPHDGARIPRLRDVLALGSGTRFVVEMKLFPDQRDWTVSPERLVDLTLEAADQAGATDRCIFQSFDWRAQRLVRRRRSGAAIAWLTTQKSMEDAPLWWDLPAPRSAADIADLIVAEGGGTWTPDHATLSAELVQAAHAKGLPVVPWTVNDRPTMCRLAEWGVDGIITDRPDLGQAEFGSASHR